MRVLFCLGWKWLIYWGLRVRRTPTYHYGCNRRASGELIDQASTAPGMSTVPEGCISWNHFGTIATPGTVVEPLEPSWNHWNHRGTVVEPC